LTIGNFNSAAAANSCLADYNWAQNALVLLTDAAAQSASTIARGSTAMDSAFGTMGWYAAPVEIETLGSSCGTGARCFPDPIAIW
jgi:hypothetical protein